MRPSELSDVIELHAPTNVSDGRGGFTVTYTYERSLYARFRPYSGGLSIESNQPVNSYSAAFICYYESLYQLTEKYKVKFRDKFYTIRSIEIANRYTGIVNVVEQSANITEIYQHI